MEKVARSSEAGGIARDATVSAWLGLGETTARAHTGRTGAIALGQECDRRVPFRASPRKPSDASVRAVGVATALPLLFDRKIQRSQAHVELPADVLSLGSPPSRSFAEDARAVWRRQGRKWQRCCAARICPAFAAAWHSKCPISWRLPWTAGRRPVRQLAILFVRALPSTCE